MLQIYCQNILLREIYYHFSFILKLSNIVSFSSEWSLISSDYLLLSLVKNGKLLLEIRATKTLINLLKQLK